MSSWKNDYRTVIIGLPLFFMPTWIPASRDERAHAWDLTATVSLNKQTDYLSLAVCLVLVAATCLVCIFNLPRASLQR